MIVRHFNPVEYNNLADAIANVFIHQPILAVDDLEKLPGAGVYALYYRGSEPLYAPLARNMSGRAFPKVPIYVGKSMPQSSKGLDPDISSPMAYNRILRHIDDIKKAGLSPDDFTASYLTLSPVWVVLAESHLIKLFQPLWNVVITGKGSNVLGGGRAGQELSRWDVVHPGRREGRPSQTQRSEVVALVEAHLDNYFGKKFTSIRKRLRPGFVVPDLNPPAAGEPTEEGSE